MTRALLVALGFAFGVAWATGMSVEDVNSWPDRIKTVTAEDVKKAAQRYLVLSRAVTGHLTPTATEPAKAPAKTPAKAPVKAEDRS